MTGGYCSHFESQVVGLAGEWRAREFSPKHQNYGVPMDYRVTARRLHSDDWYIRSCVESDRQEIRIGKLTYVIIDKTLAIMQVCRVKSSTDVAGIERRAA